MKENCPIEFLLKILSKKWNLKILERFFVDKTKKRFNQLLIELKPLSAKTLSTSLKELESLRLIKRKDFNKIPKKVEYSLTNEGIEIIKIFKKLCNSISCLINTKK